jgi:hypothetical protein
VDLLSSKTHTLTQYNPHQCNICNVYLPLCNIHRHHVLAPLCLSSWTSSSATASVTGLSLVLYQISPPSNEFNNEVNSHLFDCLFKILNSGSKAPPTGTIYTLLPYIGSITQTQWDNDIAPAIVKLTKKSPENSAQIVAIVSEGLTGLDMSQFILEALLVCIPRMLKSANQITRESAITTVKQVCVKCENSAAFVSLLACLLDTLQGKVVGSALSHAYQKESVIAAILSMAEGLHTRGHVFGDETIRGQVEEAVHGLLACIDKEPDDSIR